MVALAMALAVGACSEGEKPAGSLPQITSTPTASPTPIPSVPPFPATKQGAAAFVARFYDAENVAISTGDLTLLRLLSAADCVSCNELIKYFERVWTKGSLRGGSTSVRYSATALLSETSATVTFNLHTAAFEELDRAGKVTYRGKATTLLMTAVLTRVGSGWRMARLTRGGS